jgi:hypothetical protein
MNRYFLKIETTHGTLEGLEETLLAGRFNPCVCFERVRHVFE